LMREYICNAILHSVHSLLMDAEEQQL